MKLILIITISVKMLIMIDVAIRLWILFLKVIDFLECSSRSFCFREVLTSGNRVDQTAIKDSLPEHWLFFCLCVSQKGRCSHRLPFARVLFHSYSHLIKPYNRINSFYCIGKVIFKNTICYLNSGR